VQDNCVENSVPCRTIVLRTVSRAGQLRIRW